MKTGAITIKFKEGLSDEEVQEVVSKIYSDNSDKIAGMTYSQFKDEDTYKLLNQLLLSLRRFEG